MEYGKVIADIKHIENNNTRVIQQEQFNQSHKQKLFTDYFNNPIMTKITDDNGDSHYYAKVNTSLISEGRYMIVIVNKDGKNIGERVYMKNLNWKSIQTRSLRDNKNVNTFSYDSGKIFSNTILTIKNKTSSYTEYYNNQLDIKVYVFHTKQYQSYHNNVSLESAIEMYQTIIN